MAPQPSTACVFSGRLGPLCLIVLIGSGCAALPAPPTRTTVTFFTQPEGAFLTQVGGGLSGVAPLVVSYDSTNLRQFKDADGCYLIRGFEARWVSGATMHLEKTRICGSDSGTYQYTIARDATLPGLDKDMQFALQLRTVQAQQKQAQGSLMQAEAAQRSADAE